MMNEEEKLNDIINSKFSEEEFPFDEENWEKAEKLIDDSRKKKKRRRWAVIFFIGLVCGIAVMIPFVSKEDKGNTKTIGSNKENVIIGENKNKIQLEEKTPETEEQKNTKEIKVPSSEISENRNLSISNKEPKEKIIAAERNDNSIQSDKAKTQTLSSKTNKGNKSAITPTTKDIKPKSEKGNIASVGDGKKEDNSIALVSAVTKKTESKNEPQLKNKTEGKENTSVAKKNEPVSINSVEDQKILAIKNQAKPIKEVETQKPVSQNNIQILTDSTKKPAETIPTNKDSVIKKTDTLASAVPSNTIVTQPEKENPMRKNIFSIEAGASFIAGWNYGDTTEGRGFNPIVGLGYTRILNEKWSIHTAAYYNTISHLSSSSYSSHHIKYDFGYNSADTSITTKWLHYITVPIQLQYNLNRKNYIGAGLSVSYLITSSGTITTFNQTAFAIVNKTEVAQYGYSKGFSTWNTSVMASYGRKLSGRFSLNLIAYYGLTDLKDNAFFSKQKFERDMGARILLSYNIFK